MKKIGVIGAGNMGSAMISGMIESNVCRASDIAVFDVDKRNLHAIISKTNVNTVYSICDLLKTSEMIFLAVKPQNLDEVLIEMKDCLKSSHLIVSIAAGYTIEKMRAIIKSKSKIIRVMPNTPCMVKRGVMGMVKEKKVSQEDMQLVEKLMASMGKVVVLKDEKQIDAITAISGSGPAYFFYFIEALAKAGEKVGFDKDMSVELALETMLGSAVLLEDSQKSPSVLREQVTSKKGTTEAALNSFKKDKLFAVVEKAVKAAKKRSEEIGNTPSA